jgi:hypothetical protein
MSGFVNNGGSPLSGVSGHYAENIGSPLSGTYGHFIENNSRLSSIKFASLFPNAYQVLQTDLGLTYGGTLLATGSSPPIITLSGSLTTTPVPINIACTGSGSRGTWTGTYSFDGGLTTTAFTSAAIVPLTGKGTGLTLNIATGVGINGGHTWKATCSALADQSVNGKHATQSTGSLQPIITVGLNGKPGLLFDGVDDYMTSTVGSLISGPYLEIVVAKYKSSITNANALLGSDAGYAGTIYQNTGSTCVQYAGTAANSQAFTTTLSRFAARFGNSIFDFLHIGATLVSGVNAGSSTVGNRLIGASGNGVVGLYANAEIFAVIYTPVQSYSSFDAAINSIGGYGVNSIAV